MNSHPSVITHSQPTTQEFPMANPKLTYTYTRTVEGATYTDTFTSRLPIRLAVAELERTWGTCKWTGKLRPDFAIIRIQPSK